MKSVRFLSDEEESAIVTAALNAFCDVGQSLWLGQYNGGGDPSLRSVKIYLKVEPEVEQGDWHAAVARVFAALQESFPQHRFEVFRYEGQFEKPVPVR